MPTTRPTAVVGLPRSCTAGPRDSPSRSPPWRPWGSTVGGSTVESLADVLPMLAFFYLAAAVLQRRKAT